MQSAIVHKNIQEIKILIGNKTQINQIKAVNNNGDSPLHVAVNNENTCKEIVLLLLENGGDDDVNAVNYHGASVLHYAVCSKRVENVEILLLWEREKVNLNCQDEDGNTALHMAVEDSLVDIVKLLLKYIDSLTTLLIKNGKNKIARNMTTNEEIQSLIDCRYLEIAKRNKQEDDSDDEDDKITNNNNNNNKCVSKKCIEIKDIEEPPEKPEPGDCCGSGCTPCVWDIYYRKLDQYENRMKNIQNANANH